jgi:spore germination protein YaaH
MFVSFPPSGVTAWARVDTLAEAGRVVAMGCASADSVAFSAEMSCAEIPRDALRRTRRLLIVTNWSARGYQPDILRIVMSHAETRERFTQRAVWLAEERDYVGMLLDFRSLGPRDVPALATLVTEIRAVAHARRVSPIGIAVPVADTAAYPGRQLGPLTDFLALRLETELASPGPLTPRDVMARHIAARAAEIGAHRVMLLIPADGYAWLAGEGRRRVSFEEAVALARDWRVEFVRDESSSTLRATAPRRGEIWVNDAGLIAEIVRDARRLGIRRFALYGLGGEDPAIWSTIAPRPVTR